MLERTGAELGDDGGAQVSKGDLHLYWDLLYHVLTDRLHYVRRITVNTWNWPATMLSEYHKRFLTSFEQS